MFSSRKKFLWSKNKQFMVPGRTCSDPIGFVIVGPSGGGGAAASYKKVNSIFGLE